MGFSQSRQLTEQDIAARKKIVIVGASFAGSMLTRKLQEYDPAEVGYEILLVDKSEHFEFICSNYKMLGGHELFKEHSIMFDEAIKSYRSDRVKYKQGQLVNVKSDSNQIELKVPGKNEDGTVAWDKEQFESVSYDVLCIATGASYPSPWRGDDDKLCALEQRNEEVQSHREDLVKSPSILCIGAGSTGIETACYLKETYPSKRVAVCQRGSQLLSELPNAHDHAMRLLGNVGVEVLLQTPFSEQMREEWQFVLDCRGNRYKGPSKFMNGDLQKCLDKKTGQIFVNEFGQVTDKHPLIEKGQPTEPKVYANIFSFGDVCLTQMDEVKCIPSMLQFYCQVADNMKSIATGHLPEKQMPMRAHIMQIIPFGKNQGLMQFNNNVSVTRADAYQQKEQIHEVYMGQLADVERYQVQQKKKWDQMPTIFGIAEGCLTFLPIHIRKAEAQMQDNLYKRRAEFEKYY